MASDVEHDGTDQAVLDGLERLARAIDGRGFVRFDRVDFPALAARRRRLAFRRQIAFVIPAAAAAACIVIALALSMRPAAQTPPQEILAMTSSSPVIEQVAESTSLTFPAAPSLFLDDSSETPKVTDVSVPTLPSLSDESGLMTIPTIPSVSLPTMNERNASDESS